MDVREAIRTRRSYGKMLPDAPPRAQIERVLEAGVYAPNHHHTQPWRFFIFTGAERERLGAAQEAAFRRMLADPDDPRHAAAILKERGKPLRSPVVVVAAAEPSPDPKVPIAEEIAATAAAVQNVLLAAHAEGLATVWRTGETGYSDEVRALLGLSERAQVVGIIYLGFPNQDQPPGPRPPRRAVMTWVG